MHCNYIDRISAFSIGSILPPRWAPSSSATRFTATFFTRPAASRSDRPRRWSTCSSLDCPLKLKVRSMIMTFLRFWRKILSLAYCPPYCWAQMKCVCLSADSMRNINCFLLVSSLLDRNSWLPACASSGVFDVPSSDWRLPFSLLWRISTISVRLALVCATWGCIFPHLQWVWRWRDIRCA